jgi:multidrug resistance efflux pump
VVPKGGASRIGGSLFYLRLKAFDPDQLLDRLIARLKFIFTPVPVAAALALIAIGVVIALANAEEIGRDLAGIMTVQTIAAAYFIILLTTILHEFAHGLTCKNFGGEVREMGFMLIYFQPAMYCNVSDAWLFPEKSRRLWVTFAGVFFELVLWALAVIAWRVLAPGSWLGFAAMVVIAVSGIRLFFNLNPLIKLDGYYLLSDWLEIPNLRARAFRYVGARIKALWHWRRAPEFEATPRERRIYLVYGLLAFIFLIWILLWIASRIGGFLVENFDGAGFVIFCILLFLVFRKMLKQIIARLPRKQLGNDSGAGLLGDTAGGAARRAVYLLALGGIVLAMVFVRIDMPVSGEFNIQPTHNADVRTQVEGLIEEVAVDEGDVVEQDQVVARLAGLEMRAELAKVEARIRQTQADLRSLIAGPIAPEITVARQKVETAETRLEHSRHRIAEYDAMHRQKVARARISAEKAQEQLRFARSELKRLKPLMDKKLISQKEYAKRQEEAAVRAKELDEAQADLNVAMADDLAELRQEHAVAAKEIMEAEAKLNVLLTGSRPEEIEATEAELARLEAERDYIAKQVYFLVIRSPIDGVVTTAKPKEKVGKLVEKGDLILEVYEYHTAVGEILISEKDIGEVRLGQEVTLKARAYPDRSFAGTVIAIATTAMEEADGLKRKVVRVRTEVENGDLALKPEMTGHGKIYVGERRLIEMASRRLVRFFRVEFWSWW